MTSIVLIVDDDPFIRRLIATTLEDVSGFELRQAADGQEALEAAAAEPPKIVFLDIDMPRLDGISACRELRGRPYARDWHSLLRTARRRARRSARERRRRGCPAADVVVGRDGRERAIGRRTARNRDRRIA